MPVSAIGNYKFEAKDRVENFHGNQLVYLHWESHLLFAAPLAFPLPPDMEFSVFQANVVPTEYQNHPDFARIDWDAARWKLDGQPFVPDMAKSLKEQGIGHKSVLVLTTPGLKGIDGSSS